MVPVDKPLLYSVLTDIHSSYVMDNGRVQEYTIFLDFEKNFAHARAKCTRLSFLSGCDRKRRTPRKGTGYEYSNNTFCNIHSRNNIACASACDREVSEKLSALRKGRGAKA